MNDSCDEWAPRRAGTAEMIFQLSDTIRGLLPGLSSTLKENYQLHRMVDELKRAVAAVESRVCTAAEAML